VGDEFLDIAALGIDGGGGLDAKRQQRGGAEQDFEIKWVALAAAGNIQTGSLGSN
jgi:hypothetical protein